MVRIRCESGVRIKILESGFRNPDPYAFALVLVWFADPDHVRIRNQLHFTFWWVFLMDPDPRIQIRVRVSPNSFRKNFNMIFLKGIRIRAYLWWIRSCFLQFSFEKDAVRSLRIETRIWDRSPNPGAALRLVTGSGPDCVTTNQDWDTTYVGTTPDRLPWPTKIGKENGQFTRIERKRQPHQRTHLSQRNRSGLLIAFAFDFALHLSFNGQRHQN